MKKLLSVVLSAAIICSMTACSGSSSGGAKDSPVSSQEGMSLEPVILKFANYAVLEAGYDKFWAEIKEDFEKKYPHITIEWVSAPYGEIVNQVINMAGGGDRVDMIFGEIDWIPRLEDTGLITPITNVLTEEFLADFYPSMLEGCSIGGEVYGIPAYASPYVLFYNKDLFKQAGLDPDSPPSTYDEMLVAAEAISKLTSRDGNKVYGFGQTTASVPVSGASLTAMINNFGGTILTPDGQLASDDEGLKQAMNMIKLLEEKGYNPQNMKLKDLRNLFALGQLGMYYDQSWGFNGVKSINPDAVNFTASAKPLKGGNGIGASLLQAHVLMMVDNNDPAKTEAVRLLTEHIISEEALSDYLANITPAYPSRKSMESMDAVVNNEILKGAAGALDNLIPTPFVPTLSDINLELCTLAQSITVSGKDVDTAIEVFKSAIKPMLQ